MIAFAVLIENARVEHFGAIFLTLDRIKVPRGDKTLIFGVSVRLCIALDVSLPSLEKNRLLKFSLQLICVLRLLL